MPFRVEYLLQERAGNRCRVFRQLFGSAAGDNGAASLAPFRSHVENIVDRFEHIQVVFYYYYRISLVYKLLQYSEENLYVLEMESGSRLVEDV